MSIKNKLLSFIFRHNSETIDKDNDQAEFDYSEDTYSNDSDFNIANSGLNSSLLELSPEHPFNRLYNQYRKTVDTLPMPRLCLDEKDELSYEMVRKEKNRLRTLLTAACNARLKEAKGAPEKKPKKKSKNQKDEPETVEQPTGPPVLDAFPFFFFSTDKLYAWLVILPPINGGEDITHDTLYLALMDNQIVYGVDTRLVDHISHDERRYFNLFLVAKGKPAFDGRNGNIVDNFPRKIERVLEINEYDQVDYTALHLIHNVKQGEEISRLIKPTDGEPGRTVQDQEIPAKSGKFVPLPQGRNTEISEDGVKLLASIDGHVEFTGRSFQVKPVLNVAGNVDFSTGNISFLGDINIEGDVLSGFTVRAMGNIHIGGVIEAGSTVEAGGDLVVVKGILGDGTTTVQSQRSVFSKYIEHATICVRENIQTDCIINSQIYCDGEILVQSGRGSIMGGRIWAAQKVSARIVGSPSECKTAITLGGKPCVNFERETLKQRVNDLEMEVEKLECQPDSQPKASLLSKTRVRLVAAQLKLQNLEKSMASQQMAEDKDIKPEKEKGQLESSILYPQTEISIGKETLFVRQESRRCVVKMIQNEIVMM